MPDNRDPDVVFSELDELVREFNAVNMERSGVVTAWVLFTASSRIDDDGELAYAYDYSVGKDSDLMRSVGLVKLGAALMDEHVIRCSDSRGAGKPEEED
jgi:hypothetical protein